MMNPLCLFRTNINILMVIIEGEALPFTCQAEGSRLDLGRIIRITLNFCDMLFRTQQINFLQENLVSPNKSFN